MWYKSGGIVPSTDVTVTVVDEITGSTVASTTVPINSDITTWLNSLEIPAHEGYRFNYFEITAGNITNVTDDATVYIRYSVEGGQTIITGHLNGDGDISINGENSGWTYTGSADVVITMSKNFDTVDYDRYDIGDFSSTGEEQFIKPSTIDGNKISFTDEVIDTHRFYRIGLFKDGQRVGQTAWDSGFKPVSISVTQNRKTDNYNIVTS